MKKSQSYYNKLGLAGGRPNLTCYVENMEEFKELITQFYSEQRLGVVESTRGERLADAGNVS